MRLLAILLAASAMLLPGCIHERSDSNNSDPYEDRDNSPEDNDDGDDDQNYNYPSCAEAPSGTGYWEDEGSDGLHCNYLRDGSDDWAYTLNSSETGCMEASWAPNQNGGSIKPWYDNGNKGCDWVIPR